STEYPGHIFYSGLEMLRISEKECLVSVKAIAHHGYHAIFSHILFVKLVIWTSPHEQDREEFFAHDGPQQRKEEYQQLTKFTRDKMVQVIDSLEHA
ncbi:hypothetical protein P7K49_028540, partial [Saguinus oedipus]